jgi:hypothetical protein
VNRGWIAWLLVACAPDGVGVDVVTDPECGNGVVELGEQCDVSSPGCQQCTVVPGYRCENNSCTMICGDGVLCEGKRDRACDMTGYWAARETDYTRDTVIGALQTSSAWSLYRFEQTGDDFKVVEHLECGVHVSGSANVDTTGGTLRALLYRNRMDAMSSHGARRGTSAAVDGGCSVTFDRWYKVRGVAESFLPADFASKPELTTLTPLPAVDDPVKSTTFPKAAEDWDADGTPGVAFRISGFANGVRNTVQRDLHEYATTKAIAASSLIVQVPGQYDLQEKVLHVSECGNGCALIASVANAARDVPVKLTLSFIGRTPGSPRVSAVLAGPPRAKLDADLTTCARVRQILPHAP